jgi:hypothetical protein
LHFPLAQQSRSRSLRLQQGELRSALFFGLAFLLSFRAVGIFWELLNCEEWGFLHLFMRLELILSSY